MIIQNISEDLGLPMDFLLSIAKRNFLYKAYKVSKKTGGYRVIYHPSKELKIIQKWLIQNFFEGKISKYSTAYQKGSSIKINAMKHINSRFIFQTDIKNFFESISDEHIRGLIRLIEPEIDMIDENFICSIVLYNNHLTIGSVSSPLLSNRIMFDFDINMINRLKNQIDANICYTRYSDDICISSNKYIPESILDIIDDELKKMSMVRNLNKTRFSSMSGNRRITGIVLDNNEKKISVGSRYYSMVKKDIYNYLIKGDGDKAVLVGKLSYIKSINPMQYDALINIYGKYQKNEKIF